MIRVYMFSNKFDIYAISNTALGIRNHYEQVDGVENCSDVHIYMGIETQFVDIATF
jgi:hypothetical protein